jgi:hypothetical protein
VHKPAQPHQDAIDHYNFPGGTLLRRPTLMLAMLYYRLRDLL